MTTTTLRAPGELQSLSRGSLGHGLHLAVRSHTDPAAARALADLVRSIGPLVGGPDAGLFYGAPAVAFLLHTAAERYGKALDQLDAINAELTHQRLTRANHRIDQRSPASFAEYDILRGLAGLGALWLQRGSRPETTIAVLDYLVRLTEPLSIAGAERPGWWVWHQRSDLATPGGHANNGLAHGIAGPLAVLSLARLRGIDVPGHADAIRRVLAHLDAARRADGRRTWWDRWDGEARAEPPQPSWCYGTPGMIRTQQLAALALGDQARRREVEQALAGCLSDPDQTRLLTDLGICHGVAGLLRVVERVASDAADPAPLRRGAARLRARLAAHPSSDSPGVLDGAPGILLAAEGAEVAWDACLGLT